MTRGRHKNGCECASHKLKINILPAELAEAIIEEPDDIFGEEQHDVIEIDYAAEKKWWTMVRPKFDSDQMQRWREELGPDKNSFLGDDA